MCGCVWLSMAVYGCVVRCVMWRRAKNWFFQDLHRTVSASAIRRRGDWASATGPGAHGDQLLDGGCRISRSLQLQLVTAYFKLQGHRPHALGTKVFAARPEGATSQNPRNSFHSSFPPFAQLSRLSHSSQDTFKRAGQRSGRGVAAVWLLASGARRASARPLFHTDVIRNSFLFVILV